MKKIIVVCGQSIDTWAMVDNFPGIFNTHTVFLFPESSRGSHLVHAMVKKEQENARNQVWVTRYPAVLNALGGLIYEGAVSAEDVRVTLFSTKANKKTQHSFDEDGYLMNDWPYGVLG